MHIIKKVFVLSAFSVGSIFGQEKVLDEIVITDLVSKNFQKTQAKIVLNDSIVREHSGNLTQLLQFKTPIFFKENGYGMVSSPSFRGTTAQQTAVLWNGLPVNSFLLGQTDFNSLSLKSYDQIEVLAGGSGVLKGSGAIGGTIELNNNLFFKERNKGEFNLGYGSFATYNAGGRWQLNSKKWSLDVNFNHLESENDFKQHKKNWKNKNGKFYSNSVGTTLGYKLNAKNSLSYYGSSFMDERHFALVSFNQIPTKYQNSTFRNMLRWQFRDQQFESNVRVAHFTEQYKFFDQLPSLNYSKGKVNSAFAKWETSYKINNQHKIATVLAYTHSKGNGHDSGIDSANRTNVEASVLYASQISNKIHTELGAKIDYSSDYETPFLYSAGVLFEPNAYYKLKLRTSKNYRIPTFNDLYWQPGGNLNLNPEESFQYEINQEYKRNNLSVSAHIYYNSITNLIQWIPTSAGYWGAENTNKIKVFGAEFFGNYQLLFNKHKVMLSGMYAYTNSKNPDTNKFQIYVPQHKVTAGINYTYKKFGVNLDGLYNGEVYTRTDNNTKYNLDAYMLLNGNIWYELGKKQRYKFAFEIKNITNQAYQTVAERWLPGINYNVQLTIKI